MIDSAWALVFATIGLIVATLIYVYYTKNLVIATRELRNATTKLARYEIMPKFECWAESFGDITRVTLKNIGRGIAFIEEIVAKYHGKSITPEILRFKNPKPEYDSWIELENLSGGEIIDIEVKYHDLDNYQYIDKFTPTVKARNQ